MRTMIKIKICKNFLHCLNTTAAHTSSTEASTAIVQNNKNRIAIYAGLMHSVDADFNRFSMKMHKTLGCCALRSFRSIVCMQISKSCDRKQ